MTLTHSSNNTLGEAVSLDASYISRLRNGSRKLPKDPAFIPAMVDYFAQNINTEEQKRILATVPTFPYRYEDDGNRINQLLSHWLLQDTDDMEEPIEAFLRRFSLVRHQADVTAPKLRPARPHSKADYYFGIKGKTGSSLALFEPSRAGRNSRKLYCSSATKICHGCSTTRNSPNNGRI